MFLRIHVVKTGEEEGIVIRYLICRPSLQDPTSSDAVLMGKENTDKANVRGQRWVRELNMENWGWSFKYGMTQVLGSKCYLWG